MPARQKHQRMKNNETGSMKELIIVRGDENILIDARLLHQRLNVNTKFADWINYRIADFMFKENEDFFRIFGKTQKGSSPGGRRPVEFHITMDMAKELAMLERNETGRSIRRYFIKSEKELRSKQLPASFILPTGINTVNVNGRNVLPYREFLTGIGCMPGGGAYARKRRYPNHFINFNGIDHVSVDLAQIIGINWLLINKRKEVKQMQPLLPLEFGSPLQLKGGRA